MFYSFSKSFVGYIVVLPLEKGVSNPISLIHISWLEADATKPNTIQFGNKQRKTNETTY